MKFYLKQIVIVSSPVDKNNEPMKS